jgi:hypothetical protein
MDKYYKYKKIFEGIDTADDIAFLRNECPKDDWAIIDSIIATKEVHNCLGITSLNNIIDVTTKIKYRNDVEKYLSTHMTHERANPYQHVIFEKIKSRKQYNTTYLNSIQLEKPCPHCGLINKASLDTEYVVCGVDANGIIAIDFEHGCLNDWCFVCGKKLCKNWCKHNLHDHVNRKHNGECCRRHANINGGKYPDDYCICHVTPTFEFS